MADHHRTPPHGQPANACSSSNHPELVPCCTAQPQCTPLYRCCTDLWQVSVLIITVITLCHARRCCRCCCQCCGVLEQGHTCTHLCVLLQLLQEALTVCCFCSLVAAPAHRNTHMPAAHNVRDSPRSLTLLTASTIGSNALTSQAVVDGKPRMPTSHEDPRSRSVKRSPHSIQEPMHIVASQVAKLPDSAYDSPLFPHSPLLAHLNVQVLELPGPCIAPALVLAPLLIVALAHQDDVRH